MFVVKAGILKIGKDVSLSEEFTLLKWRSAGYTRIPRIVCSFATHNVKTTVNVKMFYTKGRFLH